MKLRIPVTQSTFGYIDVDVPQGEESKFMAMHPYSKKKFAKKLAEQAVEKNTAPIIWTDDSKTVTISTGYCEIP